MSKRKNKEIKNMNKNDREKRLKELKIELMKSQSSSQKTGSSKIKEIKKTIARILTIKTSEDKNANMS